ncbi:hypothetical protein HA402_012768 [Bradysia odoriphaga]|nr:hypothetical protein HA402_012768 [Bradysia odoriphaga]
MTTDKKKFNILLGCTGSVATIKLPVLIQTLLERQSTEELQFDIKIILTDSAKHFVDMEKISPDMPILTDTDEWNAWKGRGDPVLHIDLTKWADIFVIAPLGANSLAKIAQGLCDNLLLCTARAWNFNKPIFFCPAMNTFMWEHPVTSEHVAKLSQWGYREIPCVSKTLMCGDTGNGAMAEVETIVCHIVEYFRSQNKDRN